MTESSLGTCNPSKMASYSASLLEIAKENLTTWATGKPSRDCNTMLAPPSIALEEPSISKTHNGSLIPFGDMFDIFGNEVDEYLTLNS